jgi:hypothetical protein
MLSSDIRIRIRIRINILVLRALDLACLPHHPE